MIDEIGNKKMNWSVLRPYFISVLAMTAMSVFPAMFLYFKNADMAYFYETFYPSGIFLAIAAAYFLLCFVFMRSFTKSALAACFFIFAFTHCGLLDYTKHHAPSTALVWIWHFTPIVLLCMLVCINYLIKKKLSEDSCSKAVLVLSVVFCGLILTNAAFALPKLSAKMTPKNTASSIMLNYQNRDGNDFHPNIYYFIFDEYASFDSIKKYYDYDNSAFAEFLEKRGFTVSYDSYNLGMDIYTVTIMANLTALEYKWLPEDGFDGKIASWADNALFHFIKSYGYDVIGIGEGTKYYGLSAERWRRKSETIDGRDFASVVLGNSMLCWFMEEDERHYVMHARKTMEVLEYIRALSPKTGNTFTFSHVKSPHRPYVFDQDGGIQKDLLNINLDWANPKGYRDQYIFITKLMQEMADIILERDSGAVVIFQSDHGQRELQDRNSKENIIAEKDRLHILNAVYFKGEPLPEIHGQSGLNTLRIVLSKLLGADLPVLPVP